MQVSRQLEKLYQIQLTEETKTPVGNLDSFKIEWQEIKPKTPEEIEEQERQLLAYQKAVWRARISGATPKK